MSAIAAQGGTALLFSAEMSDREINVRRLLAEARVPASHFEAAGITPTARDWEAVTRAASGIDVQRSGRNAALTSLAKSSGSSQAAKCPPRSASLK